MNKNKNIRCPQCGNIISADEIGTFGYKMPICKACQNFNITKEE